MKKIPAGDQQGLSVYMGDAWEKKIEEVFVLYLKECKQMAEHLTWIQKIAHV